MCVTNLPTILREYVILWALGTLFGVTQEVDMVTTRASSFGRFAVAVLEPEAIPTKLDVIIGNRYFQLTFEVEPFLPNFGLRHLWNSKKGGGEDHSNGTPKDTEMKEAQEKGNSSIPEASSGNAIDNNLAEKACNELEAQMDYDWSNDLLGEEDELNEAARDFLGVQKGVSVKVTNAAALANTRSVPARLGQRQLQTPRATVIATNTLQVCVDRSSAKGGDLSPAQQQVGMSTVA
jgi:hypothetical protein